MVEKIDLEMKLDEISKVLESKHEECQQVGVLAGSAGIALFLFYYARYKDENHYAELGNAILEQALEKINQGYNSPTFCTGLAGFGWVMEHLNEEGFIELDNDALLESLDGYLYGVMKSNLEIGRYDFLHGAMGQGFYFLKRFENTNANALESRYEALLNELITGLSSLAEKDKDGLKWISVLDADSGKQGYNLSLSHGVSSIVNFLARLHGHKEFAKESKPLLDGGTDFLLAQESEHCGAALFPSSVAIPPVFPEESRLAWCYGDLGLGLSLWHAAKATGNTLVEKKAKAILLHSTKRADPIKNRVMDASPCHGALGLAQVYGYLFKQTGLEAFKKSTEHWMTYGLTLGVHAEGYAGFRQFRGNKGWSRHTDLLEGIAGIGLVMISYLENFDSTWDQSLLIGES